MQQMSVTDTAQWAPRQRLPAQQRVLLKSKGEE